MRKKHDILIRIPIQLPPVYEPNFQAWYGKLAVRRPKIRTHAPARLNRLPAEWPNSFSFDHRPPEQSKLTGQPEPIHAPSAGLRRTVQAELSGMPDIGELFLRPKVKGLRSENNKAMEGAESGDQVYKGAGLQFTILLIQPLESDAFIGSCNLEPYSSNEIENSRRRRSSKIKPFKSLRHQ
ncbi:hypothetical protein J6590_006916 [Homalodisca vitripennis]|nr:hypothetical protein J6590_006916 [Homalodisca vitripennis]